MRLITYEELRSKKGVPYSRDHLRRKCKAGEFPEPVRISTARIAWDEAEVDRWLEERLASRTTS